MKIFEVVFGTKICRLEDDGDAEVLPDVVALVFVETQVEVSEG